MAKRVFTAVKDPKPVVLIVRCSDPRLGVAQCDWATTEQGLVQGDFVSISVGGGPAALAHKKKKSKDFRYLVSQIMFFLSHCPSIEKVLLVGHQDCGFYKTFSHPEEEPEKSDLPRAIDALAEQLQIASISAEDANTPESANRLLTMRIEAYYISFTNADQNEVKVERVG